MADEGDVNFDPVFSDSPLGQLLVDPNGTIRRANGAFAEWVRIPLEELVQRNWWNLMSPSDLGRALALFGRLVQGDSESALFEARMGVLGRWRPALIWCRRLDQESLYCHIQDLSPRQDAVQMVAELSRQRDNLEAEASRHRQLLAEAADLLSGVSLAPAKRLENACRAASLPLERATCDLQQLVENIARKIEKRLPAMDFDWRVAEMPPVLLSQDAVGPALEGLLEQIGQAAQGGTVEAGAFWRNGIPVLFLRYQPETQAFEPDLAPARNVAHHHGGECWLEDDSGRTAVCLTFEAGAPI